MLFKTPVVLNIEAKDDFHHIKQLNEFLQQAFREFAASYNIVDYEILDHLTTTKRQYLP